MREYTVRFEGAVVGTRKSARQYTHAVVVKRKGDGKVFVRGFSRSEQLARKAASTAWNSGYYARALVVPVEEREIAKRDRVRCSGLVLHTYESANGLTHASARRCLKDADTQYDIRCAGHRLTDNAAVAAEADRINNEANAEWQRRWAERHAAEYTNETCPVLDGRCRVHYETPENRVQS